jgi:hypothetical protein
MWGWIKPLLEALLPFIFSGSKTTTVARTAGIEGLDRATVASKTENEGLKLVVIGLLWLPVLFAGGCAFGGARTEYQVIMVEPGDVVEIADDREIQVIAFIPDPKEPDGFRKAVTKKRIAGLAAMPKSVYRELRARAESAGKFEARIRELENK